MATLTVGIDLAKHVFAVQVCRTYVGICEVTNLTDSDFDCAKALEDSSLYVPRIIWTDWRPQP